MVHSRQVEARVWFVLHERLVSERPTLNLARSIESQYSGHDVRRRLNCGSRENQSEGISISPIERSVLPMLLCSNSAIFGPLFSSSIGKS